MRRTSWMRPKASPAGDGLGGTRTGGQDRKQCKVCLTLQAPDPPAMRCMVSRSTKKEPGKPAKTATSSCAAQSERRSAANAKQNAKQRAKKVLSRNPSLIYFFFPPFSSSLPSPLSPLSTSSPPSHGVAWSGRQPAGSPDSPCSMKSAARSAYAPGATPPGMRAWSSDRPAGPGQPALQREQLQQQQREQTLKQQRQQQLQQRASR